MMGFELQTVKSSPGPQRACEGGEGEAGLRGGGVAVDARQRLRRLLASLHLELRVPPGTDEDALSPPQLMSGCFGRYEFVTDFERPCLWLVLWFIFARNRTQG